MLARTFDSPSPSPSACAPSRAARELGLKRSEFDLAVQLGRIRTVPDESGGGGRLVERAEIDRLRAKDDFPASLRHRLQVVGTAEGAALMHIPAGRFSRLARLGLLVPVTFYLNRYRAVVWLYLAEELTQFAVGPENARLLKGRTPETLRGQLAAGVDLRARNWRGRHLGFLLRQAEDPWARAGAVAALLAPVEIADVVRDPYERACLNRFRPAPPGHGLPGSPSAHLAERITTAQDADEIGWLRSELARSVEEAREASPAPRPAVRRLPPTPRPAARPIPPMARTVTRRVEERTVVRPAGGTTRPPEPVPSLGEPTARDTQLPLRTLESWVRPAEFTGRPAVQPLPRGPEPAQAAPPRSSRGLRAWLRRRGPRPARPARV
ncbi:DUF6397 family protein [Streptomyces sp. NRRL S-1022]|uniref:DUF6397 family protein n=1 Tax=Streptomyces sp. NRRL S-1022 TaxID=1463880 RepID=UPI000AD8570A|nr:DUF6397 family protein [Streptomyces sp. NRRL S-1022]